jgi:hypothetical protein
MKAYKTPLSFILAALLVTALLLPLGCAKKAPEAEQTAGDPVDITGEPTAEQSGSPKIPCKVLTFASSDSIYVFPDGSPTGTRDFADESKIGTKKTIKFAGKSFSLVYKSSIQNYSLNNVYDVYDLVGYDHSDYEWDFKNRVSLRQDGSVVSFLTNSSKPIVMLDIKWDDSEQTGRAAVEDALKNDIDFSRYECFETEDKYVSPDGYSYSFRWYNKKNGNETDDYCRVNVFEGGITHVGTCYPSYDWDSITDEISFTDSLSAIEDKLREVYGESLLEHEIIGYTLSTFEGQPCFNCMFGIKYTEEGVKEPINEAIRVIVQLQVEPEAEG